MVDLIFDQTSSKASILMLTCRQSSHASAFSASKFSPFLGNDGDKSIRLLVFQVPVGFFSDFRDRAL
jgi:hypothetical protein